jgi:hypothetical protein
VERTRGRGVRNMPAAGCSQSSRAERGICFSRPRKDSRFLAGARNDKGW